MQRALIVALFLVVTAASSIGQSYIYVAPQDHMDGLYAWCIDQNGNFIPYCTPSIYWGYYQYSGGHYHDDASHLGQTAPPGPFIGTVTNNGQLNTDTVNFQVSFRASRTGELEFIDACANVCNELRVVVAFPLNSLSAGPNYTFIGATDIHPDNHWGMPATLSAISTIANAYANAYSGYPGYQIVGVNDIAIPYGGVFDICATSGKCNSGVFPWQSPHSRHDYGKAVDFRANGGANSVLPEAFNNFLDYCRNNGLGSLAFLEDPGLPNQHIHCDGN